MPRLLIKRPAYREAYWRPAKERAFDYLAVAPLITGRRRLGFMALLALAKDHHTHRFSVEYLKESIILHKDGTIYIYLRPMILIEEGSGMISYMNLLFEDKVSYQADATELLNNEAYMTTVMEREFLPSDPTTGVCALDGYRYILAPTQSADRWAEGAFERPATTMRVRFTRPLIPRDDGVLHATHLRLTLEGKDTRMYFQDSEKRFVTSCRRHQSSRGEASRRQLEPYNDPGSRIMIRKHEIWVAVEGPYAMETRPEALNIFSQSGSDAVYRKEFGHPRDVGSCEAAKFVFESANNEWLNNAINIYYRKRPIPRWIPIAGLILALIALLLHIWFNILPRLMPPPPAPQSQDVRSQE